MSFENQTENKINPSTEIAGEHIVCYMLIIYTFIILCQLCVFLMRFFILSGHFTKDWFGPDSTRWKKQSLAKSPLNRLFVNCDLGYGILHSLK